jgi:hypothetical protein
MRIRRELGAVLAGILTTVLVIAAVEFGRQSGLLRLQPPEGSTDRLLAVAGTTTVARERLANPRLHFRWL